MNKCDLAQDAAAKVRAANIAETEANDQAIEQDFELEAEPKIENTILRKLVSIGDNQMTEEEFNALIEEHEIETFLDEQGGVHLSQEAADAANVGFGKTKKIGEAEGFEFGTEVAGTDEEGNAITTDESLTGGYKSAYEQLLADA